MEKKQNIFVRFFKKIGYIFHLGILWVEYFLLYIIFKPKAKCKIVGKNKVKKDKVKVFVANHYEIFGPVAMFLSFPYKFRPWVIDKMLDPVSVEKQMSISVYNNFPKYPIWFKKLAIKCIKNLMVMVMKHAKAISVSRESLKDNLLTLEESSKTLSKGTSILIFPEDSYVQSGVGKFQTGFENLAKYYYKKTNKCITFYPVFVSQENKKIYIEEPITYNPNNNPLDEKSTIINHLYDKMLTSYIKNECGKPHKLSKKRKNIKKICKK